MGHNTFKHLYIQADGVETAGLNSKGEKVQRNKLILKYSVNLMLRCFLLHLFTF